MNPEPKKYRSVYIFFFYSAADYFYYCGGPENALQVLF